MTLAACQGGGGDSASPTTTAPRGGTATTVAGLSDTCSGFRGTTATLKSVGPAAPASLIAADAGAIGCLDVVTFTFRSLG